VTTPLTPDFSANLNYLVWAELRKDGWVWLTFQVFDGIRERTLRPEQMYASAWVAIGLEAPAA
jgi:hypothetical protein